MFCPSGTTFHLSISGSSVRQALSGVDSVNAAVRLVNGGSSPVGFAFGDSTVTANSDSPRLPVNVPEVLAPPPGATHIAVYCAASADVFVTTGAKQ